MATAHPASSEAGPQPESDNKPKSQPETHVDAGTQLEAASPVAASPMAPEAISRGSGKKQGDRGIGAEAGEASGVSPLVIAGEHEAAESSASHLAGSSDKDIQTVDAKFQRLLATVHENRP
ncbi:MAG TPA: GTP pyrophosphokinase, partial [Edaphobacter sp.]|nr:GTP pyrophosphokinase [Edaphobacter sp.]